MGRRRYRGSVEIITLNIRGEDVEIRFDPGEGVFSAKLIDEEFANPSFNALRAALMKKAKEYKPAVLIPVTQIERGRDDRGALRFTDLTVTGVHAANRNIMTRNDETGEIEQHGAYTFADSDRVWDRDNDSTPDIVRRLTAAEKTKLNELSMAEHAAERAREKLQRSFKISIRSAIEKAQKKAAKDAQPRDEFEGDPRA
jgi:hypothetical protein